MSKKQEPVAFRNKNTGEFCTGGFLLNHGWDKEWIKLYTHPKEWQGLSDDEIEALDFRKNYMETYHDTDDDGCYFDVDTFEHEFAKAIEQKLKEKNS